MKKRKILGINGRYLANQNCGMGRYIYNILCLLSKYLKDYRLILFTPERISCRLPQQIKRVVIPANGNIDTWEREFHLQEGFKQNKPDFFFTPYFNVLDVTQIPQLVTVHDLIPLEPFEIRSLMRHPSLLKLTSFRSLTRHLKLLGKIKRYAPKVIAVSEYSSKRLGKFLKRPDIDLSWAHNGFRDGALTANSRQVKEKISKNIKALKKNTYFLYVGGFGYRKNVDRLLKAYRKIPENIRSGLRFVITGSLEGDKRLANRYNDDFFIHLPFVNSAELSYLYKNSFCFAYPSLAEGFGLPPLEASYYRTPVICSDISSIPEVMGQAALYFNPFSVRSIKRAMIAVISSTKIRKHLSDSCQKNCQRFSWEKPTRLIAELIKKLPR